MSCTNKDYKMSIERLNILKGYHWENCVLVIQRMNYMDFSISSLYPERVYHGMTREKWNTIVACYILS